MKNITLNWFSALYSPNIAHKPDRVPFYGLIFVQQHLKSHVLIFINKLHSSSHLFIHSPVFCNNSTRTERTEDENRSKQNPAQELYANKMRAKATSELSGANITSTCLQKSKKGRNLKYMQYPSTLHISTHLS
jgi:hypothetical protein